MAYIKTNWTDTTGQIRYTEQADGDYKIFTPNYEDAVLGTPVNAENMNHIENGIEQCYTDFVKRKSTTISTGNRTTPVYIKADGTVEECEQMPDITKTFIPLDRSLSANVQTSLMSVLPNDGQIYFIWIYNAISGTGSGASTTVTTDIFPSTSFNICDADSGRSSASRSLIVVPVGTGRYVTVTRNSKLVGYMKA